ncbi:MULTISPECIES: hypothetical protein [Streptomyces]|uniref:Uncharacterized protein n=1 Tax=Streptomyces spongiae TaxID=565072 RepID=A0A5N8XNU6_9ACTN|nr:hypothetical protein [Streptomyces spongiae]MPY61024.1 hypothetical protein [Streptomyces spongiae]
MPRQFTELVAERTDAERDTHPRRIAHLASAALRTPAEPSPLSTPNTRHRVARRFRTPSMRTR